MALTVRRVLPTTVKDAYMTITTVDFDSSYPTGGLALTAAQLGFSDNAANLTVFALMRNGYQFQYDGANAKLLAYQGDNANASPGPAIQVANTTNLSTVTGVQVIALGKQPADRVEQKLLLLGPGLSQA